MDKAGEVLLEKARKALAYSYSPYSRYRVGAALESHDGRVFTGCNVENNSYGATVCAERVALYKAISEGAQSFTRLAVASEQGKDPIPCGLCRQSLWEITGDIDILVTNGKDTQTFRLKELYPHPFT